MSSRTTDVDAIVAGRWIMSRRRDNECAMMPVRNSIRSARNARAVCASIVVTIAACSHSPARPTGNEDAGSPPDTSIADAATPATDAGTPQLAGDWYRNAVGYEIFVRSFQDTNGDGIGDLRGITARLDYLQNLGVDLLWLMPINDGPSYHGYEVQDYREIETDYGTLADFDELITKARERNIHVILDLVVNHSSSDHRWFTEAARGRDNPYRNYYVWKDHDPGWTAPWGGGSTWYPLDNEWYYGIFWRGMPDLNYQNPAVRSEMAEIAKFWLNRGADGFRLDAARYLVETGPGTNGQADTPETHEYWRELRTVTEQTKPNALLVGEVWESTAIIVPYFGTPEALELHMNFDFPGASGILNAIRRGDAEPARLPLTERLRNYPEWATAGSFLANHDQYRVATVLENGGLQARKLAAALLLSWPGTPWLYYGEEIGMKHGEEGTDDRLKRRPMQWTGGAGAGFTSGTPWFAPASIDEADSVRGQENNADSQLELYRRLIALRKEHAALRAGTTRVILSEGSASEPLVLVRASGPETIVAIYNFASSPNEVRIPAAELPAARTFRNLMTGEVSANVELTLLEPFGFRLYLAK